MVISYTIDELNAIGEMMAIKEVLSQIEAGSTTTAAATNNNNNTNQNFHQEFLQFHQLHPQLRSQIKSDRPHEEPLTYSVAEFFRKAQQNFYAQTSIDPTKVRSLSEIEAELIGRRESS